MGVGFAVDWRPADGRRLRCLCVVPVLGTLRLRPWRLVVAAMQMRQSYDGPLMVVRRLRRIQLISDVLFLGSALLMLANQSNFLGLDYFAYIKYVHNNWVVVLLVAAILQLYAGHRIANEIEKEAKKR